MISKTLCIHLLLNMMFTKIDLIWFESFFHIFHLLSITFSILTSAPHTLTVLSELDVDGCFRSESFVPLSTTVHIKVQSQQLHGFIIDWLREYIAIAQLGLKFVFSSTLLCESIHWTFTICTPFSSNILCILRK